MLVPMANPRFVQGAQLRVVTADDMLPIATDSNNLRYQGVIYPHPSWVEPVNNRVYSHRVPVGILYPGEAGVCSGYCLGHRCSVPFHRRMIDVPVDERDTALLKMPAACAAREVQMGASLKRLDRQAVDSRGHEAMSVVISLRQVVNELSMISDDYTGYLNRHTGEFLGLLRRNFGPRSQASLSMLIQSGNESSLNKRKRSPSQATTLCSPLSGIYMNTRSCDNFAFL